MREAGALHGRPERSTITPCPVPGRTKGSATGFDEDEWFVTLKKALRMEELITKHSAIMDSYDPAEAGRPDRRRMGHLVRRGAGHQPRLPLPAEHPARRAGGRRQPEHLPQPRRPRADGQHRPDVNVLQAMILTDGAQDDADADLPRVRDVQGAPGRDAASDVGRGGAVRPGGRRPSRPSASPPRRSQEGSITVSLCNLDLRGSAGRRKWRCAGAAVSEMSTWSAVLTSDRHDGHNTFDHPDAVKPVPFNDHQLTAKGWKATLPPRSVVVLEMR